MKARAGGSIDALLALDSPPKHRDRGAIGSAGPYCQRILSRTSRVQNTWGVVVQLPVSGTMRQGRAIGVTSLVALICLATPAATLGSWIDPSSWFGGCPGKRGQQAGGSEQVVKPDLYVKYSHFRKLLQAEEAGEVVEESTSVLVTGINSTGDATTIQSVADLSSLNPCREQKFISGFAYSVGVLQWPGANVGRWLDETGDPRNPCTDQDFSDLLEAEGAFVALFKVRVGPLLLLLRPACCD